jgi:hypothetical protein
MTAPMDSRPHQDIFTSADRDMSSADEDRRWQAALAVGELVGSHPAEVWEFVRRWGNSPCEDTRDAVATCILEHLLEYHFDTYFPRVEELALADPMFGDTFLRCWKFGQSQAPANERKFDALKARLERF